MKENNIFMFVFLSFDLLGSDVWFVSAGEAGPGRQLLSEWAHTHRHTPPHTHEQPLASSLSTVMTVMTSLPVFQHLSSIRRTWRTRWHRRDWTTSTATTGGAVSQVRVSSSVAPGGLSPAFDSSHGGTISRIRGLTPLLVNNHVSAIRLVMMICWCSHTCTDRTASGVWGGGFPKAYW